MTSSNVNSTKPPWAPSLQLVDEPVENDGVVLLGLHVDEVAGLPWRPDVVLGLDEDELVVDGG